MFVVCGHVLGLPSHVCYVISVLLFSVTKNLVKLAYCDITADTLIERGYEGPYNVVIM